MRVLVTGGTGFVGAHCVRALLERGHDVAILARAGHGLRRLADLGCRVRKLEGELCALPREEIRSFRPEGCLHLAWYAEPGKYLDAVQNIDCLTGSFSLLRELIQAGCHSFVAAGTCFEYGPQNRLLREGDATAPETLYAAAKLSLCEVGQQLARLEKVRFAWGRIFHPYGPQEDRRRAVPAAINAMLEARSFPATGGEHVRDYVHVEDVAAAFVVMLEEGAEGVFNVCSAKPVSMRELFTLIGRQIGKPELIEFGRLPSRSWDPPYLAGENWRLRLLGWEPRRDLEAGIGQTIEWWRTNRESA